MLSPALASTKIETPLAIPSFKLEPVPGPTKICSIADKFGLEVEYKTDAWLWQDTEQFTINDVHVDYDKFNITFGLYLPLDDSIKEYGTQFWEPKAEELDLDKSLVRENCNLIDQVPFISNYAYFMPRTNNSWHSSPIIDKPMMRRHVYGYYSAV